MGDDMGMQQKVVFSPDRLPTWTQLSALLAARRFPLQMRMIDGELAFPDESPPETWRELRVGTAHGMVTLQRDPDGVTLVTWGNADEKMRQAWNALAWGLAYLAGGTIGTQKLDDFIQTASLPDNLLIPP
jgi:hypothetical protein